MRKRWIYINGEAIPADDYAPEARVYVRGDTAPYQSMVTGEMIEGRVKHREHLKTHNVHEVGDAYDKAPPPPKPRAPDPRLREAIARHVYAVL